MTAEGMRQEREKGKTKKRFCSGSPKGAFEIKFNLIYATRNRVCFSFFPIWGALGFASTLPFTTTDLGQPQQEHGDVLGGKHPSAPLGQLPALRTVRQSCHFNFIALSFQKSPN